MSPEERDAIMRAAMGRIFRLGSRPTQPGDIEQYEAARRVIFDVLDPPAYEPITCWARDRLKGADGQ